MKYAVILISVCLASCSSQNKKLVDEDIPTMKEVYQGKFHTNAGLDRKDVTREIRGGERDLNSLVRDEIQPIRAAFRYLPNPILTMYIYPHLTDAGTPVPGYATFFKFYEKDHIGLPSEFDHPVSDNLYRGSKVKED